MAKVSQNITVSEVSRALDALRTMHGSFKKSVEFYSADPEKEKAMKWNQHRLDDICAIAALLKRIDAVNDSTEADCPF